MLLGVDALYEQELSLVDVLHIFRVDGTTAEMWGCLFDIVKPKTISPSFVFFGEYDNSNSGDIG